MAGHEEGGSFGLADPEDFAVLEEVVELAAVGQEAALEVEELAEGRLDDADVLADGDAAADLVLDAAGAGEVVGVAWVSRIQSTVRPLSRT